MADFPESNDRVESGGYQLTSDLTRFWQKVEVKPNGCWEWTGALQGKGYGHFSVGRKKVAAHRWYYEQVRGEVPTGFELDHKCRNLKCVNPDHLEVVTHLENVQRGVSGEVNAQRQRAKTHCPKGHPYDEDNTYINPSGQRSCRACRVLWSKEWRKTHSGRQGKRRR